MGHETAKSLSLYCAELSKIPLLEDADVEFGLILRWKQNNDAQAKNTLLESHLRFVLKEAKRYATNPEQLQEYIGEGHVGLLEALKRYDVKRTPRIRFLTYAYWWIKERILRTHYGETCVTVPSDRQKAQRKAVKDGHADSVVEGTAVSFEASKLSETVADAVHDHDGNQTAKHLRREITTLTPREQTIVNLHYGMKDEPRSDTQIAKFLGLSHERIRQMRMIALKKLQKRLQSPVAA